MLNFNLWNFVSKHTYDSPENQINLLISSIKNIKSLKNQIISSQVITLLSIKVIN